MSQHWQIVSQDMDSIAIKLSQVLITKDTFYYSTKDTTVVLAEGVKYRLRKNPYYQSDIFYDSLRVRSNKNKISKELYNLIFKTAPIEVHDTANFDNSENDYIAYNGKIIRNIIIKKVDIIVGSIHDTTIVAISKIEKSLNKSHYDTRDWVILNNLSFKKGDVVDSYAMAENERLLRRRPYIEDARIFLKNVKGDPTKVDVLVITKDEFSIGVGLDFGSINNFRASLFDKNFLGLGHRIEYTLIHISDAIPDFGHRIAYEEDNIANTFINARGAYEYSGDKESILISLNREFLTFDTEYAGGITVQNLADNRENKLDDSISVVPFNAIIQDYWLGRSIKLLKKDKISLNFSARYVDIKFKERPFVDIDTNFFYHNRRSYFAEIALLKRKFYKSSRVLGFGVTEDIPFGYIAKLTGGYDKTEFTERPYFGATIAYGKHFERAGYIMTSAEFGSFANQKTLEDGVLKLKIINIGNIHQKGVYSIRNFTEIAYQVGINQRDIFNKTKLRSIWGRSISGINTESFWGNEKLSVNFESVLFTPWYYLGFKIAPFGFAEMGWVSQDDKILKNMEMYSSFGAGMRIKNESWVINTITIGFAFYILAPEGSGRFGYMMDTSDPYIFKELNNGKPGVLRMDYSPLYYFD